LQPFAQLCLLPHTHQADPKIAFCACWSGFLRLLPSVRAKPAIWKTSWRVATQLSGWRRDAELSRQRGDSNGELPNPYRLKYEQTLYVQPIGSTKPTTHTFIPGEIVSGIAAQHRISAQELLAANPGVYFNSLVAGHTLHLSLDAGRLGQRSSYSGMTVLTNCPFCAGTSNAMAASTASTGTQTAHG